MSRAPLSGLNGVETAAAGWVAGAGAEWAFTANWLVRAEYLYYGFGGASASAFLLPAPCNGCALPINFR